MAELRRDDDHLERLAVRYAMNAFDIDPRPVPYRQYVSIIADAACVNEKQARSIIPLVMSEAQAASTNEGPADR